MKYNSAHAHILIRETDNAGALVTHQERALRNDLQAALDEIARLNRSFAISAAALEAGEKERRGLLCEVVALQRQVDLFKHAAETP